MQRDIFWVVQQTKNTKEKNSHCWTRWKSEDAPKNSVSQEPESLSEGNPQIAVFPFPPLPIQNKNRCFLFQWINKQQKSFAFHFTFLLLQKKKISCFKTRSTEIGLFGWTFFCFAFCLDFVLFFYYYLGKGESTVLFLTGKRGNDSTRGKKYTLRHFCKKYSGVVLWPDFGVFFVTYNQKKTWREEICFCEIPFGTMSMTPYSCEMSRKHSQNTVSRWRAIRSGQCHVKHSSMSMTRGPRGTSVIWNQRRQSLLRKWRMLILFWKCVTQDYRFPRRTRTCDGWCVVSRI